MKTIEESVVAPIEVEAHNVSSVESMSDDSMVHPSEVALRGIDRVVLEGYRNSVRARSMTPEQAARSFRMWKPDSVFIPEDF